MFDKRSPLIIVGAAVNKQHIATAEHYAAHVYIAIILTWEEMTGA
jgi:hypothetical protein